MPSEEKRDKSKKRKRTTTEERKSDDKLIDDVEETGAKRSKGKEGHAHPGYFVMPAESKKGTTPAADHVEGEERVELLPEDKKEISDLLDDIEERKRKKREKRAMRKTKPVEVKEKEPVGENSIEYLKEWKNSRDTWKFKSAREAWLIRNWRDSTMVPDDAFEILVPYFESMKGARREVLRKEAKAFTKKFKKETDDYKTASQGSDSQAVLYRRAKAIRKALRSDDE